nr:MAG TPA: hypothetical protein [Bacteriophage sp.]
MLRITQSIIRFNSVKPGEQTLPGHFNITERKINYGM